MRDVVAEFKKPVMLYSIGKDSSVMLHLALKAFYPAKLPFPLLHVDTTWKFREMIAFRDETARRLGLDLIVHVNQDGLARGINPIASGSSLHTQVMKTEALKQALDLHQFDAAFGGARRDEEKSRAKERIFSFRSAGHVWDPRNQRPELWNLFNTRIRPGETMRVFPLSNWTELDVWEYIMLEKIPVVPLYFAKQAAGGAAQRHLDHGRRRPPAARAGRNPRAADDPVPHARMLSAQRRDRVRRQHDRGHRHRDADRAGLRAAGPADRQRRSRIDGEEEARGLFLMDARASPGPGEPETKDLLRFITCGSVDDGKSTLIGRLLHDCKLIFEDQLTALQRDSARHGTTGDDIDFALLVDGLEAEREQGITIDVAYRFFTTPKRSFIVADTPGHEQYTRNMATGASNAQLAIILIDARKGVLVQTRRHSFICSLLGIRHVVLAVNKIDLVDFDRDIFDRIVADYAAFAAGLGFASIAPIPISARFGDNIINRSSHDRWYHGPCLLDYLERIDIDRNRPASRSVFRCNGSTGRTRTFAAMPAPSRPAVSPPATRSSWPPPGARRGSSALSPMTATRRRRRPETPSRSRWRTKSMSAAAMFWPGRPRGRKLPISSPRM